MGERTCFQIVVNVQSHCIVPLRLVFFFVDVLKVNKLPDVLTFLTSIRREGFFSIIIGMGSMPKVVELFEQRCLLVIHKIASRRFCLSWIRIVQVCMTFISILSACSETKSSLILHCEVQSCVRFF